MGIVGLPNVGKSAFNALTSSKNAKQVIFLFVRSIQILGL